MKKAPVVELFRFLQERLTAKDAKMGHGRKSIVVNLPEIFGEVVIFTVSMKDVSELAELWRRSEPFTLSLHTPVIHRGATLIDFKFLTVDKKDFAIGEHSDVREFLRELDNALNRAIGSDHLRRFLKELKHQLYFTSQN